jgi:hypothetical protein
MAHCKIKGAWALCKAIDYLCLYKTHRTSKGRPIPFANHTMLAHWWRKLCACWCKQLKTFMARGKNGSAWVPIVVKSFLCLNYHCHGHPRKWSSPQNQIYWGEIDNDHIGQGENAINNKHDVNPFDKKRVVKGHEFACACETWNLTFFMMASCQN